MYPRKSRSWKPLVAYLKKKGLENKFFIGPEVLLYEFPKVLPYQILKHIRLQDYDLEYVVFHKKQPEDMTNEFLDMIKEAYKPVWANHMFVVFKKHPSKVEKLKALKYALFTKIRWKKYYKPAKEGKTGILITTYNRPAFLEKLLKRLENRKEEIVVVNDGSDTKFREHYEHIKRDFPKIVFIDNPKNMGLVYSLNMGFAYFLADPDTEWVHYFQDDVVFDNKLFEQTAKVADKDQFPVVTGLQREPHKVFGKETINGIEVLLLRSAPAHHWLIHRQYLMDNMPIPNPYPGAPKPDGGRPGQGSDADWWLLSWSPKSIVKRGGYIAAIPDLVRTDMNPKWSTWAK